MTYILSAHCNGLVWIEGEFGSLAEAKAAEWELMSNMCGALSFSTCIGKVVW